MDQVTEVQVLIPEIDLVVMLEEILIKMKIEVAIEMINLKTIHQIDQVMQEIQKENMKALADLAMVEVLIKNKIVQADLVILEVIVMVVIKEILPDKVMEEILIELVKNRIDRMI